MTLVVALVLLGTLTANCGPPEVYVYTRKTNVEANVELSCMATGFLPKEIVLLIKRNQRVLFREDGLRSTGTRPNGDGTFQRRDSVEILRTDPSTYTCEVMHAASRMHVEKEWDYSLPGGGALSGVVGGIIGGVVGGIIGGVVGGIIGGVVGGIIGGVVGGIIGGVVGGIIGGVVGGIIVLLLIGGGLGIYLYKKGMFSGMFSGLLKPCQDSRATSEYGVSPSASEASVFMDPSAGAEDE